MVENRLLGDTVGSVDLCEEIDAVGECGVGPAGGEELEEWLREGDTWRENFPPVLHILAHDDDESMKERICLGLDARSLHSRGEGVYIGKEGEEGAELGLEGRFGRAEARAGVSRDALEHAGERSECDGDGTFCVRERERKLLGKASAGVCVMSARLARILVARVRKVPYIPHGVASQSYMEEGQHVFGRVPVTTHNTSRDEEQRIHCLEEPRLPRMRLHIPCARHHHQSLDRLQ